MFAFSVDASKRLTLSSMFSYVHRKYGERTVFNKGYLQKDNIYTGTLSIEYKLTEKATFETAYTYTQSSSNEPYQEYSQSVISCGVRYYF